MKLKLLKVSSLFALSVLVGSCVQDKPAAEIQGYDGGDLTKIEASQNNGNPFGPRYELIAPAPAGAPDAGMDIRMAVFISNHSSRVQDNTFSDIDAYNNISGVGNISAPATGALTCDVKDRKGQDYGCTAFNSLQSWFSQSGFLKPLKGATVVAPIAHPAKGVASHAVQIEGMRAVGWGGGREAKWTVSIFLGSMDGDGATAYAQQFGAAAANNHITMLNGHFYSYDLTSEAAAEEAFNDAPVWSRVKERTSKIYGPAIDSFVAAAKNNVMPYRMVVFNGCMSEQIEDMLLRKAQENATPENPLDRNIDLITMNGYSNYHHFGPQIANLAKNFALGTGYKEMLDGMSITTSGLAALFNPGKQKYFRPMVRSRILDEMCEAHNQSAGALNAVQCGQKKTAIPR